MKKKEVIGLIRHALTFAGGWLVTKGIGDPASVQAIVGAIVTVVGAVWSIIDKKNSAAEVETLKAQVSMLQVNAKAARPQSVGKGIS